MTLSVYQEKSLLYKSVLDELPRNCDLLYSIQEYVSSHSKLVIRITPYLIKDELDYENQIFLVLRDVSYMKVIPFWRDKSPHWVNQASRKNLLTQLGVIGENDRLPRMIQCKSGKFEIAVAFNSLFITEEISG